MRPLKTIRYLLLGSFIFGEVLFPLNILANLEEDDERTAYSSCEIRRGRTFSQDHGSPVIPHVKRRYFSAPKSFLGGRQKKGETTSFIGVAELWPPAQGISSLSQGVGTVEEVEQSTRGPIFMSPDWHDGVLESGLRKEWQQLRAQQRELEARYRQMMERKKPRQRRNALEKDVSENVSSTPNNGWSTTRILCTAGGALLALSPVAWVPMAGLAVGYTALAVGGTEFLAAALIFGRRSTS